MRQLAGTKTRYRRAHAAPLAELISYRVEYDERMIPHGAAKRRQPEESEVQAVAYRESEGRIRQVNSEAVGLQATHLPASLTCTSHGFALRSFRRVALPVRSRR